MSSNKKKIGIQLPRQANPEEVAIRYSLELEALDPVAEIIEVAAHLFEKLDKLTGNARLSPAWLLSHPKAQDRIAAIQSNYAKWQ